MTFALIQINPLQVLQTYAGLPDPVLWPDGSASHGISPNGFIHGAWALAPAVYAPAAPAGFYTVSSSTPSFDGQTVTFTQSWAPPSVQTAQTILLQNIEFAAEQQRAQYLKGPGQTLVNQQTLSQAVALQSWMSSTTTPPTPSTYPLLTCGIGLRPNAAGTGLCTGIVDVMNAVFAMEAIWISAASAIETTRLTARNAITAAPTVSASVSAFNAVAWPATVTTATISTATLATLVKS